MCLCSLSLPSSLPLPLSPSLCLSVCLFLSPSPVVHVHVVGTYILLRVCFCQFSVELSYLCLQLLFSFSQWFQSYGGNSLQRFDQGLLWGLHIKNGQTIRTKPLSAGLHRLLPVTTPILKLYGHIQQETKLIYYSIWQNHKAESLGNNELCGTATVMCWTYCIMQ